MLSLKKYLKGVTLAKSEGISDILTGEACPVKCVFSLMISWGVS